MKKKYIELNHIIRDGMITYKGLPAPIICDYLSREDSKSNYEVGTSFQIGKMELVGNTGTYVDCPFHRFENGKDLSEVALEKFVDLETVLIEAPYQNGLAINADFFKGYDIENKAVLVCTGWSEHWTTDQYFEDHPYLTEDAAIFLKEQNVVLVGIDSLNIDNTNDGARPVHTILLGNDILIVEHMNNLESLIGKSFLFSAVPPRIEKFGTFPVRAFATIK